MVVLDFANELSHGADELTEVASLVSKDRAVFLRDVNVLDKRRAGSGLGALAPSFSLMELVTTTLGGGRRSLVCGVSVVAEERRGTDELFR